MTRAQLLKRPRLLGGLVGALIGATTSAQHLTALRSIVLAGLWFVTLWAGGKFYLWRSVIKTYPQLRIDRRQSWAAGFVLSALSVVTCARWMCTSNAQFWSVMVCWCIAWAVCYAGSKLGCHKFGCCGWKDGPVHRLPLQVCEAVGGAAIALLTVLSAGVLGGAAAVILFFGAIALLRALGRVARRQPVGVLVLGLELCFFVLACILSAIT